MRPDPDQTLDQTATGLPTGRRVTVREAAGLLGTTVEGVRSRIKRGTLTKVKGEDGTVYVLLDPDQASPDGGPDAAQTTDRAAAQAATDARTDELIAELRAQNEHLRDELSLRNEELRRKDTILMTLAQRVPELEPAREDRPQASPTGGRESSVTPSEGASSTTAPPAAEQPVAEEGKRAEPRPSFWRRLFLGDG
jgi:Tfp pilus assembly protein FimV